MKHILQGIIAVLIVLGIVKTFLDYDAGVTINRYYQQFKQGDVLPNIENVNSNNLKHFDLEDLRLSDFF